VNPGNPFDTLPAELQNAIVQQLDPQSMASLAQVAHQNAMAQLARQRLAALRAAIQAERDRVDQMMQDVYDTMFS
jgi:hypothetical protein